MASGSDRRPVHVGMELFDRSAHLVDDGSGRDDLGIEIFGEERSGGGSLVIRGRLCLGAL